MLQVFLLCCDFSIFFGPPNELQIQLQTSFGLQNAFGFWAKIPSRTMRFFRPKIGQNQNSFLCSSSFTKKGPNTFFLVKEMQQIY